MMQRTFDGESRVFSPTLFAVALATASSAFNATAWAQCGVPPTTPIGKWCFVDGNKVRVWWNDARSATDKTEAIAIRDEVDGFLWTKLTALMGREPVSDRKHASNGGDARLDIRVDLPEVARVQGQILGIERGRAVAIPLAENERPKPVFLVIERGLTPDQRRATVAHELMHAILFAFNVDFTANFWLHEATARWAEHFAYPSSNLEHASAKVFFSSPKSSLDEASSYDAAYSRYLFLLYLQESSGDSSNPTIIRRVWERAGNGFNPLAAIDAALTVAGKKGFKGVWREFIMTNWNTAPISKDSKPGYVEWDKLTNGVFKEGTFEDIDVKLAGKPADEFLMAAKVKRLSSWYFRA